MNGVINLERLNIGFAMCGSFCTLAKAIEEIRKLKADGHNIIGIMSENAYTTDTRFGAAKDIVGQIEEITGNRVLHQITEVEPIGPEGRTDVLIVAPCTGNTLAKLANGITDTAVTMAVKSHLRGGKPLIIALATNDGLSGSAQNLGHLLNIRHVYFVPLSQDDIYKKPNSVVADFELIGLTLKKTLEGKQLEPRFY